MAYRRCGRQVNGSEVADAHGGSIRKPRRSSQHRIGNVLDSLQRSGRVERWTADSGILASEAGTHLAGVPIWLVSLGGVALTIVWLFMILQGKASLHRWDEQLRLFEQQLGVNQLYPLFTNIWESGAALNSWTNGTAMAAAVPVLCAITWLVLCASS